VHSQPLLRMNGSKRKEKKEESKGWRVSIKWTKSWKKCMSPTNKNKKNQSSSQSHSSNSTLPNLEVTWQSDSAK
jgi:hypothetical protein